MSNAIKILIVDDEPDILEFLGYNLKKEGYTVFKASNGIHAIEIAKKELPQLIMLDVMMDELDGMETCKRLKQILSLQNTIIIFLTARGEEYSQLAGYESGADDYITKPVKPQVLMSKIKALLRRIDTINSDIIISVGTLKIDTEQFIVYDGDNKLNLPKKEFLLLKLLAEKPGKVFHRDEILRIIWGDDVVVGDRTIDVHIRKLREKLSYCPIGTVKGVGYKFELD
jgi:two-component system alkaline phosphatase synthesis response regulator PhoP